MSDLESIYADAQYEEQELIKRHYINPEPYYTDEMIKEYKSAPLKTQINCQTPLVQKYWLGRLVYELAIRNKEVQKKIKEINDRNLSKELDLYSFENCTAHEKAMIIALEPYGFTPKIADDRLFTEHTTYPTRLIHAELGYIIINTISKFNQLIDILDGAPKKKYDLNNDNYKKWKKIGKFYTENYFAISSIH
jgi:hypothetical protein